MKRIVFLLIVCTLLCLCGCKIQSDSDDISPVRTDLTFDDIVELCGSAIDVNIPSHCENMENNCVFSIDNHSISYTRDYQLYLADVTKPDDCGIVFYQPRESEYHIIRGLSIDGFKVLDFESSKWAIQDYCEWVDESMVFDNAIDNSTHNTGYYFVDCWIGNSSRRFSAYYYLDTCIVSYTYTFNSNDVENYLRYLDFCDALGLPTSDQITEDVMGSVS